MGCIGNKHLSFWSMFIKMDVPKFCDQKYGMKKNVLKYSEDHFLFDQEVVADWAPTRCVYAGVAVGVILPPRIIAFFRIYECISESTIQCCETWLE
jgi:hypothetical protein